MLGPIRTAFGLHWRSDDLAIEELPVLLADSGQSAAGEVVIATETPSSWPDLSPGPHDTPFLQMKRGDLRLTVEEIGRFRITNGTHIAWHREHPGVSDQDIRTFLLGSAVGALLIQRGMLVLHGNALEKNGQATVSELRQELNTSRKVIMPLLDRLDRDGVTIRNGDYRTLVPRG